MRELPLLRAAFLLILPLSYLVRHSLPFSWHIRLFLPYLARRWKSRLAHLISSKRSSKLSQGSPQLRIKDLPIGKDPFEDKFTRSFVATLDDCDILGHLSNSSYPKNLDVARSNYAASSLFQFQADGGWVALGSISFKFHREIAAFARYTIRARFYLLTDKWFYLKNEFISNDTKGNEVLHCESISKHCFKLGRKTIPPWFVLAYSGYSPSTSSDRLSNWEKSQKLRLQLQKANPKINPLIQFKPGADNEEWMRPEYWDVGDWRQDCTEQIKELHQYH